ncbi:tumor necrosis factor ligand superfamily member 14 [Cyclopterus lumpus]|uniref:THD domain-containing protein n=1 Tax=Cyclopterus lumpus TaxID=8103 RepID=A0A8C2X0D3_CYCLU|nr:tumor necrosis factor ligand superfamily member 14 [Cyclopterus lumpus]
MSKVGYPSVCVVDTYSTRPAVPPRRGPERRRTEVAQTLLFLLVSVALCGAVIEACFIYNLYRPGFATPASFSKLFEGKVVTSRPKTLSLVIPPSKPVAHLTGGQDVVHGKQIMAWSMDADPLLYEMGYENKSLVIQKEGYYHVYSKVSFLDIDEFHHSINRRTERYSRGIIPLLISRRSSEGSSSTRSNSYLAGVFHLHIKDTLFVEVSQASRIVRITPYENVFGAYMI